ncbi:uncharacterized protein LOC115231655 [Octopus sinensis]|uniref:Uncharacterized protein LOC115231655 n=1 Tax=Octopus sinensis TaxID=2607531 RepID=A0A6P7U7X4_9MOLL|nr:uncharacterized protein LOC115231655 [Octopus sinensis]
MPVNARTEMVIYADDIILWDHSMKPECACRRLQVAVDGLANWCGSRGLRMCADKCSVLKVCKRTRGYTNFVPRLLLSGSAIAAVDRMTYLGVLFKPSGKFDDHIARTKMRAMQRLGALRAFRLSRGAWFRVFNAMVLPVLTYGVHAWYLYEDRDKHVDVLKKVRRRAIRLAYGLGFRTELSDAQESSLKGLSEVLEKIISGWQVIFESF